MVWQIAGPSARTADLRAVAFSWLGLAGTTPRSFNDMAGTFGRSGSTLRNWMRDLAAAELARPTLPGEDHLARVRRARLLGAPEPARVQPTTQWREWNRQAVRIVDAVGPVTTGQLTAGLAEYRARALRRRSSDSGESYEELPVALEVIGDLRLSGGRWHPQRLQVCPALLGALLAQPDFAADLRPGRTLGTGELNLVGQLVLDVPCPIGEVA